MAKQVSLRKMWFLCNQALRSNLSNKQYNLAAINAYSLWQTSINFDVQNIVKKFGSDLNVNQLEPLAIYIEKISGLPVKDSDILIEKNDRTQAVALKSSLIFYLHNIRSGFNIGSMIRLADGLNIQQVILSGYTATPKNSQVLRASLGAEKNIEITQDDQKLSHLNSLITKDHYELVALETAYPNKNLMKFSFSQKTILLVGNEKNGLPQNLISRSHHIVKIPMFGIKNSLNVVSALSMASYEWSKQWRM